MVRRHLVKFGMGNVAPSLRISRSALADLRQRLGVPGLTGALALAAVATFALVIQPHALTPGAPTLEWWVLAALFAMAEVFVIHLAIGPETHSFSLIEIPLVLGLFLATPVSLLVGQFIGAALVLAIHRRQPVRKLAFNLASFAFSTSVAIVAFLVIVDPGDPLGPRGWVAAFAAALVADVVSGVNVELVIAASTGQRPSLSGIVGAGLLYTLVNASLGLVAVLLLVMRTETAWLAAVLTAALYVAYRISAGERQKRHRMQGLHEATRDVQEALSSEFVTQRLLDRARHMFGAERAELLIVPAPGLPARRTRVSGDDDRADHELAPIDATEGVWARVAAEGAGILITTADAPERLRVFLATDGIRNLMAAPVHGESGIAGVLAVMNREGNVGGWRGEDLTLLETLANHAGVALRNGELVDGLAARAAENEYQARHDALTGLPNRTWFQRLVDEAIAGQTPAVALLTMDLDAFKEINDTLGHQNGDEILCAVAERLRDVLVEGEIVCRLGGDEFAMLTVGSSPLTAAAAAERIAAALAEPFTIEGLRLGIAGSIGIALFGTDGSDAGTLLRHADVAMYNAKAAKVPYEFYAAEHDGYSPARMALAGDFRRALDARELAVWYQPKVDMASGRIVGAEALVRWLHPTRGLVMPDGFIPVIEQTSLLRPMTLYVLEAAIGRCAAWRASGMALGVAVNLSARDLLDLHLTADVSRLLTAAGLPPSALTLEITESAMMADRARAEAILGELRASGLRIAIDDYGTGHASLAYLKRLPVSELKIDRSFVMGLGHDTSDRAIVRSTIDLAHDLGLETVAEGVEERAVWGWLAEHGCDSAQGFLMGKAIPSAEFEEQVALQATSGLRVLAPPRVLHSAPRPRRKSSARPADRVG